MSKRKVRYPIDYRSIGQGREGAPSIREHQDDTKDFTSEWNRAIDDGLIPIGPAGNLLGVSEIGINDYSDANDPVANRMRSESCACADGRRSGVLMGNSATMLDYSQQVFSMDVKDKGTPGLGFAIWGPGNCLPSAIYKSSAAMPYTASALDYLDRTFFGLGAKVVYVVSRYSGGTVTHEEMDYRDAEVYLKERVIQFITKLDTLTSADEQNDGSASPDDSSPGASIITPARTVLQPQGNSGSYRSKLIAHYEKQLDEANAELERYFADRAKIDYILENNNLSFFLKRWISDTVRLGICFPVLKLSATAAGKWTPTIDSFEMRDACVMRLEQRDPDNAFKINHVFYSERWRDNAIDKLATADYVDYPCINPEHPLTDLRSIIHKNHRTKVAERPYEVCYPCYNPTPTKPYYPQLPWWSIFPSQVYQYASTLIYDKATARKNSTMWGKILFINTAYLAQIFAQAGDKGKTAEGQAEIRKSIYNSVENFLKRRDNNGKLLVMDSYPSADEKQMIDSVRIVDVPRNDDVKASANETAEMCSLVSYSLGVNMSLVGSSPSMQNQGTGTAQRELHLLKNGQLSPERVTFTDFFNNFVFKHNDISPRFSMRLFYPTLTTLDNSKTGTVEQSD